MLEEVAIGGLLFSPLIFFVPIALSIAYLLRLFLYKTGIYTKLWKPAWIEVSLFVLILFFTIQLFGV